MGAGVGMASKRREQARRREAVADLVLAHHAQDLLRLEHPEEEVGRTGEPPREEQVAGRVGDRPGVADHAVPAHPLQRVRPVAAVQHPVVVRVPDTLRLSRRSRRVADHEPVVAGDLELRIGRILGRQPGLVAGVPDEDVPQRANFRLEANDAGGVALIGHHNDAVGAREHVTVRLPRVPRVQRHPNGSGDRAAQEEVGASQDVVLQPGDPLTRADPHRPEPVRERARRDPTPR